MSEPIPRKNWRLVLESPAQTGELASRIAAAIDTGGAIAFHGGLGSGKTTFIQALAAALGCGGLVTSPTYTIINRYEGGRFPLVHVDCYRIRGEDELWDIGLAEMFTSDVMVCVEWSEKAAGILPDERLGFKLETVGRNRRNAELTMFGNLWPALDSLMDQICEER